MRTLIRAGGILAIGALAACSELEQGGPSLAVDPATGAPRLQSAIGAPQDVNVELVAQGLNSPVYITNADDGSKRIFIVDQVGDIWIVTKHGERLPSPFFSIRPPRMVTLRPGFDERGLLGLAFHPRYKKNGRFFVFYNAPTTTPGMDDKVRISEFRVSANPNLADMSSERILLEVDKPQFNHNGGTVAFGPDGFLYISIGDGGGANDQPPGHVEDWYAPIPGGNGQDVEANLLGNILRIDVDHGTPYGIPPGNPFVGRRGLDEIYAYGLRNPYRIAFDTEGSRLFAGDAGQSRWEEVSVIVLGGNYGWNVREGTHCFSPAPPPAPDPPDNCPRFEQSGTAIPAPMPGNLLRDPVIEYRTGSIGRTVIGGNVYRGNRIKFLRGDYVFGDWSRAFGTPDGTLLASSPSGSGLWPIRELRVANMPGGRLRHFIHGFGLDEKEEVYVAGKQEIGFVGSSGKVWRLEPVGDDDEDS